MAMTTRCRMPPDSSKGYWLNLRSGSEMPTSASSLSARSFASFLEIFSLSSMDSVSCLPIFMMGFRLDSGS